jgi:surface antigen
VVKPKPTKTTTTTKTTARTNTRSSWGASSNGWWTVTSSASSSSSSKIVKKWTYNANINNGFYRGYCTWYVATQVPSIFKYTSEWTQDRPFGWNASSWYSAAKAAWYTVSKTPRAGSIIVYSKLRSSAGHVWIVRQYPYNWDSSKMLVEDMNYAWKFVVTKRIETTSRGWIIGYIYY